jgi:hypothetical protein
MTNDEEIFGNNWKLSGMNPEEVRVIFKMLKEARQDEHAIVKRDCGYCCDVQFIKKEAFEKGVAEGIKQGQGM